MHHLLQNNSERLVSVLHNSDLSVLHEIASMFAMFGMAAGEAFGRKTSRIPKASVYDYEKAASSEKLLDCERCFVSDNLSRTVLICEG